MNAENSKKARAHGSGNDCRGQDGPRTCHHGLGIDLPSELPRRGAGVTRRRFLKGSAIGAAGLIVNPRLFWPRKASARDILTQVVHVHHPGATTGWTVNQEPVDVMVHMAIRALTGITDTAEAWKSLFPGITPAKKVAIKINLACGDVPTHPEVVNAIIDGLLMMDLDGQQLPEENIIVWDADTGFMCPQTGYTPNWGEPGVQYVGTDHPSVGYDFSMTFPIEHTSHTTYHHPSRILTEHCDYLINAAVAKDHDDWAGVTFCMKNHYGSYDGIYSTYTHYSGYNTGIPGVNQILRDELGDPTSLLLIDGTLGLYDGGPGYTPPWHTPPNWQFNSILVGLDPVAIDRIGTVKINEERAQHGLGALDPGFLPAAAGDPYNLGTDNLEEIDLIKINLGEQAVSESLLGPNAAALLAPYPNPTRGACTLRFHCATKSEAEIVITDATGAVVRRLTRAPYGPGTHRLAWNGRDDRNRALPSGTYFCILRARGKTHRRQFVLVH